ncbi:MAG TPA: IS200/IS605 family transposase [Gemmatimonadales bacterium]
MPSTVYVHLVWKIRVQSPELDASAAAVLTKLLPALARKHGATLLEVSILQDHVHTLLLLPPVVDIPRLVQGLKGASSRILNRDRGDAPRPFRWASGYSLHSVSPRAREAVARYIRNQRLRHPLSIPR